MWEVLVVEAGGGQGLKEGEPSTLRSLLLFLAPSRQAALETSSAGIDAERPAEIAVFLGKESHSNKHTVPGPLPMHAATCSSSEAVLRKLLHVKDPQIGNYKSPRSPV